MHCSGYKFIVYWYLQKVEIGSIPNQDCPSLEIWAISKLVEHEKEESAYLADRRPLTEEHIS